MWNFTPHSYQIWTLNIYIDRISTQKKKKKKVSSYDIGAVGFSLVIIDSTVHNLAHVFT